MSERYKTYLVSYPFKGDEWCFEIMAANREEAEERVKAMCFARVDGEVALRIKLPFLPIFSIERVKAWFR